jgi:ABC-type multidrug transport system permease subunit
VVPEPGDSVIYRFDQNREDARLARLLADQALQEAGGRPEVIHGRDQLVRERGSRYIDFLLPGLLAMNLMGTGVWGTGFAVVDQRRKRLLKRLVATPMRRSHYLASFVLSRLGLLVVEVAALLGFGALVFGVPVRGSLALIAGLSVLTAVMFGGLGLLLAARPRTIEGASGLMNLALLPMWVLSGVFFSAANFPDLLQPLIQALPLTAAVDALRATMLEGASLTAVAPEIALQAAWTVGCFALALKLFRWQ